MGPKESLMQLASEAVRVAAQSPFLENAVGRARAVLCCLYLPPLVQRSAGEHSASCLAYSRSVSVSGIVSAECIRGACIDVLVSREARIVMAH
jgi:hypothetical protein